MPQIPITRVRYSEIQAGKVLRSYLFADRYGTLRPPRGIDPAHVAELLTLTLKPAMPALWCQRVLETMRFYEIQGLSAAIKTLLMGSEPSREEAYRSALLLQALADLGSPSDGEWAFDYFDRVLVDTGSFAQVAELLRETLLVLAPYGSSASFARRLRAEIAGTRDSRIKGNLKELEDNRLPGLERLRAGKKRLIETPPERHREELISIYLTESDLSQPYLVTWAARMIRRDAEMYAGETQAEFGKKIDSAAAVQEKDPDEGATFVAAAQGLVYLQGKLTPEWRKLYDGAHPEEAENFLWDDDKI